MYNFKKIIRDQIPHGKVALLYRLFDAKKAENFLAGVSSASKGNYKRVIVWDMNGDKSLQLLLGKLGVPAA